MGFIYSIYFYVYMWGMGTWAMGSCRGMACEDMFFIYSIYS